MASAYENIKTVFGEEFAMKNEIEFLKNEVKSKDCQIKELQSYIDQLKANLEEANQNRHKLPSEPIDVASMLITAGGTCRDMFGREGTYEIYTESDLRQIAEHLLVYCNHAEVE